jgi:general stress protein 26
MTARDDAADPIPELAGEFSDPAAHPMTWNEVVDLLEGSEMFWLSTVRRDGRPHVAPLPAMWLDGALHFCTGPTEQKAKNLEHNPSCAVTTGTNEYRRGTDVVVEGRAIRVTDPARLRSLAQLWKAKIDWKFDVGDGVFLDTESEGSEAYVFEVQPSKILAFGKAPYSQTRFRFKITS